MFPLLSVRTAARAAACVLLPIWLGVAAPAQAAEAPLLGWETLARLDRLPEFKPPVEMGSVSSYDRTGGNDDGFSGKYSFVRKEADGLVLADLEGPGVIYRLWTPTPSDDFLEFYFDGEAQPRIRVRFRELFLGRTEPFLAPLAGYGVGGFFSYVPLPYARSCKIVARAERIQFYQINYARYRPGTPIESFTPSRTPTAEARVQAVRQLWTLAGSDLSAHVAAPGAQVERHRQRIAIPAGGSAAIFERTGAGRMLGLRLGPTAALANKSRGLLLRIAFDGEPPAVLCPAGDFFGFAWGQPATRSLLVGATAREAYCHFPMPFERSARIELVSEDPQAPATELEAEVAFSTIGRRPEEGRFYALWRRENPTTVGQPFTFIDTQGRGHLVGCILQAQGMESGSTLFFEGDDQTWLDGRLAVHGTGSEDFFNGGWYDVPDRWEKPLAFPLSGCLGYQKHLGRTGGYRLFLGDAYSYGQSLRQTIEHAGTENSILTDYAAVTYVYSEKPPSADLRPPAAAQRRVHDLQEIVFAANWQIPIRAFPFQDATLTRRAARLGNDEVRYLSFRGGAPDWVGPPYLFLTCHLPVSGKYEIALDVVRGPEQGVVQLFQDEVPVGDPMDLYAPAQERERRCRLGILQLQEGDNPVMLKVVRKNDQARAHGLDLVHVVCKRLD